IAAIWFKNEFSSWTGAHSRGRPCLLLQNPLVDPQSELLDLVPGERRISWAFGQWRHLKILHFIAREADQRTHIGVTCNDGGIAALAALHQPHKRFRAERTFGI